MITVEITPAELVDRLTIMMLKVEHFRHDPERRPVLVAELNKLTMMRGQFPPGDQWARFTHLESALLSINRRLWVLEDKVRQYLKDGSVGLRDQEAFCEAASRIFLMNNARASTKQAINRLFDVPETDPKSHNLGTDHVSTAREG